MLDLAHEHQISICFLLFHNNHRLSYGLTPGIVKLWEFLPQCGGISMVIKSRFIDGSTIPKFVDLDCGIWIQGIVACILEKKERNETVHPKSII